MQKQYANEISNVATSWNNKKDRMDFIFDVRGFTLRGNMNVTDSLVIIEGKNLPEVEKEIIEVIRKNLKQ